MTGDTLDRTSLLASLAGEPEQRRAALEALLECTPDEIEALIDADVARSLVLQLGDASRGRQRQAAEVIRALVAHDRHLASALREALAAPDPRLRWGAAYTIGHCEPLPPLAIWPAVRETLGLADGDQRWSAAELACELARHHSVVLEELAADVRSDSATTRKMVLYCLRDLAIPELPRIGRALLADPDSAVRLAALSALARETPDDEQSHASAAAVAALVDRDPDPGVRRAAAAALGRLGIGADQVLAALERARSSDDESLRRAAEAALTRLGARRPN